VVRAKDGLRVWDLRRIRAELVKLGLDWDAPPYPPADEKPIEPLEVEIDRGDIDTPQLAPPVQDRLKALLAMYSLQIYFAPYHPLPYHVRGNIYSTLGQFNKAIEDYAEALRWQPPSPKQQAAIYVNRANCYMRLDKEAEEARDLQKSVELYPNPTACNNLAQIYANGPARLRDPAKALVIAGKGLQVKSNDVYCRNSIGVAHYRLGHYDQAVVALERSLRDSQGDRGAFQLYFLAMCHARLGDAARAKACYDEAVQWYPEKLDNLPWNWAERLKAMRSEAAAVLTETGKR
jgi:tetratricopeptide (TPR) repeat protein